MRKYILILTTGLIILYSCVNKEKEYFLNESEIVNEQILHNLSKIEENYMLNPAMATPFFVIADDLKFSFDSILFFVDQENFKEVHNRFINLYSNLKNNTYLDSKYIQESVITTHFNKWIGSEKKYDFSENKEILKLDLLNLENELTSYLYHSIEADYYKFNRLQAMVVDSSNNIKVGETYHASIFLAAFDTTRSPAIMVANGSQPDSILLLDRPDNKRIFYIDVIGGKGDYKMKVQKPGKHELKGVIRFPNSKGEIERFMFYQEFTVRK